VRGLTDALLVVALVLVVVAVTGETVAQFVRAVALPLAALLAGLILARLVWFYTSRW
jgi:hypothetical protein